MTALAISVWMNMEHGKKLKATTVDPTASSHTLSVC